MQSKIKKLLAFLLVAVMAFQFGGATNVVANDLAEDICVLNTKPLVTDWESQKYQQASTKGDLTLGELKTAVLNKADIPEIINLSNIEKKQHVNRLYKQETDLNTIMFQNRDGSKTTYQYPYPVKYVSSDGKIKDKSNELSSSVMNKSMLSKSIYATENNDVKTYYPNNLAGEVISTYNDTTISTRALIKGVDESFNPTIMNINANESLKADTVLYSQSDSDDIDIQYVPSFEGYVTEIIFNAPPVDKQVQLEIKTNGLSAIKENEKIILLDQDRSSKATIDQILSKRNHQGIFFDGSSKNVEVLDFTLEEKEPNETYILTLLLNEEFFSVPESAYPLSVTESFNINVYGSGNTKTIIDAPIYKGYPNNNFGGNYYLSIGKRTDSYNTGRTIMRFPGIFDNPVYYDMTIGGYVVYHTSINLYEGSGNSTESTLATFKNIGPEWYENTVTYNGVGDIWAENILDFTTVSGSSKWYNIDVTSHFLDAFRDNTKKNQGVLIVMAEESDATKNKTILSTEYPTTSLRPFLTVEWAYKLPTNGYEKTYDTSLWNYYPAINNNNCYAYSINNQVHDNGYIWYKQQPGEYSGHSLTSADLSTNGKIAQYTRYDLLQYGGDFIQVSRDSVCSPGRYKVALVVEPGIDYHWYRQNSDGTWSHKQGTSAVKNKDNSNYTICDPFTCDRGNYTLFIGYFEVTPVDQMYSPSRSSLINSANISQRQAPEFDYNRSYKPTVAEIESLHTGMLFDDIVELIGLPHENLPYNFIVLGYENENGELVKMWFTYNSERKLVLDKIE